MHLDESEVQRLLHGELAPSSEVARREHLAACDACRQRVDAAAQEEAEIFALLGSVDHPVPATTAQDIEVRAPARDPRRLNRAAGIALALGVAGAAYAAPGSPLPRLMRDLTSGGRTSAQREGTAPSAPAPAVAGVAIEPGQRLVIAFASPQSQGTASVRLTEGREVIVRAAIGAATFSTDADRLAIDNRGRSGTFEIEIPRGAPRVEIVVAGDLKFLKDADRIVGGEPTDAAGVYRITLR